MSRESALHMHWRTWEKSSDLMPHIVWNWSVQDRKTNETYQIFARYTELRALRDMVAADVPRVRSIKFPSKTPLQFLSFVNGSWSNTDGNFLRRRGDDFDRFFDAFFAIPEVCSNAHVTEFLKKHRRD
eukprot:GILK01007284.1.p1 GENE.GILK01007284.1~~GILK01007284.1.p1  ORF type:complete len:128 (-),score=18.39 GILK01007284.1:171-554(-)